jgi:3D (Asp-Asp-Asp) domain-containing protein
MDVDSDKNPWPYWRLQQKMIRVEHTVALLEIMVILLGLIVVGLLARGCQAVPDSFGASRGSTGVSPVKCKMDNSQAGRLCYMTKADARRGLDGPPPPFAPSRSDFFERGHSTQKATPIACAGASPDSRLDGRRRVNVTDATPPTIGLNEIHEATKVTKKTNSILLNDNDEKNGSEPTRAGLQNATKTSDTFGCGRGVKVRSSIAQAGGDPHTPAIVEPQSPHFFEITAYEPSAVSCGKWADGKTASGLPVTYNGGKFVAADPRVLPMGSLVRIPGYASDQPVPVIDVGGAIQGRRLDVYFPTVAECKRWGRQKNVRVEIVRRGPRRGGQTEITMATKITKNR